MSVPLILALIGVVLTFLSRKAFFEHYRIMQMLELNPDNALNIGEFRWRHWPKLRTPFVRTGYLAFIPAPIAFSLFLCGIISKFCPDIALHSWIYFGATLFLIDAVCIRLLIIGFDNLIAIVDRESHLYHLGFRPHNTRRHS